MRIRESILQYLDIAGVIILALDDEGNVTLINRKGCELLGYSQSDIMGRNWFEHFIPEEEKSDVQAVFAKLMQGELDPVEYHENRILAKDNLQRIIAWHNIVLKDAQGKVMGTLSSGEDITERKKAEVNLQRSVSLLRATLESTADGILVVDKSGKISDFNEKFVQMWRIPSAIMDSQDDQKALDFVLDQLIDPERFITKVYELYGHPEVESFDVLEFKDGRIFERYSRPQRINDCPVGRVWSFRDVTERKRVENELRSAIKEKETLLQELNHRVNNNLQLISNLLSLQRKHISDKNVTAIFEESQNRIQSIALIHEKLYLTKGFSNINLSEYISELAKNIFHSFDKEESGIHLSMDIENIKLDIERSITCGLIINEMLSNALKYAFPEQQKGQIVIKLQRVANGMIELLFSDNGVGIPENMDFKGSQTLGMKLIRTLAVEQLDGVISVDKTQGTTFRLKFKDIKEGPAVEG